MPLPAAIICRYQRKTTPPLKNLLIASLFILASLPAQAGVMSYEKKIQMCGVFAQANAGGMSGKEMLRQMLVQRGDPGYMANVIHGEIKDLCPRAY